jgi:hypothetical protein
MKSFALKSPTQARATFERAAVSDAVRAGWPLLVLLAATFLVVLPIIMYGSPTGADLPNHYRFAFTYYEALRTGDLYPGWLHLSNFGYGDPSVRFYPPALYYLMACVHALTGDWFAETLPTFAILTFAGVCGAYFWARSFVEARYAVWAGVFYAFAPYRLNESLEYFLLAEYAGGAALLFAFGFVERITRQRRWSDVAGLGAAYAMLILTHLPLTVMGSLMLGLYALLRIERGKVFATLSRLGAGVLIGLAASSRYWVMMIAELSWIRAGRVAPSGWYDYRNNFLFTAFDYNAGIWWTNYIALATLAMFVPALVLLWRRKGRAGLALGTLAILSFIMTTSLSRPLWSVIPKLKDVQFPWRWLAVTSAVAAVMMAVALPVWAEKLRGPGANVWRKSAILACGLVTLSFFFVATHFMEKGYYYNRQQFNEEIGNLVELRSHKDWWPVWLTGEQLPRLMAAEVEAEGRQVSVGEWKAGRGVFQVSDGEVTEARVHTLYYPHWKASARGVELRTRPSEDGVLLVSLPKDAARVEVEFREPLRVGVAAWVTALGWTLIAASFILSLSQKRRAGSF